MAHLDRVAVWDRPEMVIDGDTFPAGVSITYFDTRDMLEGESEDDFISRLISKHAKSPRLAGVTPEVVSVDKVKTQDKAVRSFVNGEVVSDAVKVKENIRAQFNANKCKQDFYQTLGSSIGSLAPFWGVLSDMITFRNFEGIKAYANGLLSAGILKVEQYDAINEIFKSQNLDLDNL